MGSDDRDALVAAAVDVVARHIIATMAAEAEWMNWPEIGEYDWESVYARVLELAPIPDKYADAYDLLTERANREDDDD